MRHGEQSVISDATWRRLVRNTTRHKSKSSAGRVIIALAGIGFVFMIGMELTTSMIADFPVNNRMPDYVPPEPPAPPTPARVEWKSTVAEPEQTPTPPPVALPLSADVSCVGHRRVSVEEMQADRETFAVYGFEIRIALEFLPGKVSAKAVDFLRQDADALLVKRYCGMSARKTNPGFAKAAELTKLSLASLRQFNAH